MVTGYGRDDEAIAEQSSQVDAQEEPEVQVQQLLCVCECENEELGHWADIVFLIPSGQVNLSKEGKTVAS